MPISRWLHGHGAAAVRWLCTFLAISRVLNGQRAATLRLLYEGRTNVQSSYDLFWPSCPPNIVRLLNDHAWPSHNARAGIVRCHIRRVYGLRSYYFQKFVKLLKPNRRVCGARENRTKIAQSRHGGFAEVARKGGYDQFTGSIDTSQATCELGLSCITAMIDR